MHKQRRLLFTLTVLTLIAAVFIVGQGASAGRGQQGTGPDEADHWPLEQTAGSAGVGQAWRQEIVDMPGFFDAMSDRSLQFDSAGNIHMVYGGDRLYYAVSDGSAWQVEMVDDSVGTGTGASLALDDADRPHISYMDLFNMDLKYAYLADETWSLEVVDKTYPYQERTSIAIDGAGRPHIAYKQQDWQPPDYCSGMGYASWTGSTWQIERFHDCGNFVSMALDSAGQPHITFNNSGQVKRATKQTGSWQVDDVGASNGYGSSVAVDSNDRPHVVYVDMDYGGQLIYANWDGSQWVTQSVQPADAGLYLSLTLDDADMAHIAVGRDYVVLNGANPLGVQSASAVAGSFSSIALDVDGHPAISYRGFASSVRCDRWDGSVWVTEVIDYGGSAGTGNAIGLDSQDYPYISHYRTTGNGGGAIELAWRNDDGWATETISGTYVPSYAGAEYDTSLAVDSGDAPHVSFWYSEYYADGLYYGVKSGEQWQFEKIAEDADGPNDLVLDSADGPHIAFVDNGSLYYGYRSGGGWNVSDVGVEAEPRVVSLKLDGADRPRIIFVDWEDGSRILQLAAWTGTAWAVDEIATVDGNSGVQAALALDAAGKAHVAYVVNDDESGELRYAVEGGADWASEVVDSRRWGITSPNILLLEGDAPTIVYHYQGLQVATKAGGTWDVQEIFRLQYSGDVSAVADSGRRLLVSYYDGRGHGLMFAGPPFLNPTDFVYLPMALRS